ncbi:MAG: 5-formyltetrahydrofolate cyclo-ligase [Clostridia bacterium]|nr:5-formyltetrahydrofolate cyclo-ligase [Clostridia bacterium]
MDTNKFTFVETPSLSVEERKRQLREYAKKRRAQNENRDIKEERLVKNFFKLYAALSEEILLTEGAGTRLNVFTYLSYSLEAPTDKLVEGLALRGAKTYAPRIENGKLLAVECGEDFSVNRYGIREPIGEPSQAEMHVVITPLLAVDEQGNRLGYGGGYYDRYLQNHPQALRIGYCYDFQIQNDVPSEKRDMQLDFIVTEKRILAPKRKN